MPYKVWHLRVFVAAPADLDDERAALEEVIEELNLTSARLLGIWLELLSWRTHAFPAIGADAQAVINEEIDDAFEIFVGLLWTRIGTSTPRAISGTLEEYRRAHRRHTTAPESVSALMYFKSAPISPMDMNPQDLAAIQTFRQELPAEGALHWSFKDIEEFKSLLRMHLTRTIEVWKKRLLSIQEVELSPRSESAGAAPGAGDPVTDLRAEDFGLLDYSQRLEEFAIELPPIFERLSSALDRLRRSAEMRAALTQELARLQSNPRSHEFKELINAYANDLVSYAETLDSTTAEFSMKFGSFMDCASKFTIELAAFGPTRERLVSDRAATIAFGQIIRTSRERSEEFKQIVAGLPRMTSELNRAKRRAAASHDKWSSELLRAEKLVGELAEQIGSQLGAEGPA